MARVVLVTGGTKGVGRGIVMLHRTPGDDRGPAPGATRLCRWPTRCAPTSVRLCLVGDGRRGRRPARAPRRAGEQCRGSPLYTTTATPRFTERIWSPSTCSARFRSDNALPLVRYRATAVHRQHRQRERLEILRRRPRPTATRPRRSVNFTELPSGRPRCGSTSATVVMGAHPAAAPVLRRLKRFLAPDLVLILGIWLSLAVGLVGPVRPVCSS